VCADCLPELFDEKKYDQVTFPMRRRRRRRRSIMCVQETGPCERELQYI